LHKQYLDATTAARHVRSGDRVRAVPHRSRPPSPVRRALAVVLARAARAADGETARRVVV
jgi:hypothetical protein